LWLVSIPPIKSVITYAVALHEIGHVLGRYQRSRSTLVRGRWAWAWAQSNAINWTPAMARTMERSQWYVRRRSAALAMASRAHGDGICPISPIKAGHNNFATP
jgi:hypothetical protein